MDRRDGRPMNAVPEAASAESSPWQRRRTSASVNDAAILARVAAGDVGDIGPVETRRVETPQGWMVEGPCPGHHGEWSCLIVWLCGCETAHGWSITV